jgi:L-ascorbate metabolism protein UlaG (beta-lactamase superfamily)
MLNVTWLGHSSFEIKLPTGEVILLDPWLEGNPSYPAGHKLTRCDAILLSHAHGDHVGSTMAIAPQYPAAKLVAMYELATHLEKKGVKNTVGMNKGGTCDLGFAQVSMTHAIHSSSFEDEGTGRVYGGEPAGFAIHAAGKKLYFAGDTCVFGDMRLIAEIYGPFDAAMLPIGDLYTMGPREASFAARLLRPKQIIPMHWGTFPALTGTPAALAELIHDLPGTSVAQIKPGESVVL